MIMASEWESEDMGTKLQQQKDFKRQKIDKQELGKTGTFRPGALPATKNQKMLK